MLGNPPWVTAAALSRMGADNRPERHNLSGLRGLEAKTGRANFDIAEWMLIRLIESMDERGLVGMLCKTGTARRVLRHFWRQGQYPNGARLYPFDAKKAFGIAASACLFVCRGGTQERPRAGVFAGLDSAEPLRHIGLAGADIVADIDVYERLSALEGGSGRRRWRSGLKHDAARVMEFFVNAGTLINGLGERIDIEPDRVYPLLKASEIGHGYAVPKRAVLVPQMTTGEDTRGLRESAPKTWAYLCDQADALDARKSSIYRNRPRFAIFGVGAYSFAPWKVAISGFDPHAEPVVMGPHEGKPVIIDDTSYSLGFDDEASARRVAELMRSGPAKAFLRSLVFDDAKRPVTAALLNRIDLGALERMISCGIGGA